MRKLLTRHIASMTEMREPHKVLECSAGKPVAILKNSSLVGYFVPAGAVQDTEIEIASDAAVLTSLKARNTQTTPVRDHLQVK
ncbi:MAG: antitoxin StbD [Halieaceae bacterium]|jgi:antitoxin StbD